MIATRFLLICLAATLLPGCSIFSLYTLGEARPSMMKAINTLSVPVSKNKTLEPNVEALLADTIVKQIQTDGTYSIDYSNRADAVILTTLTEVERRPARSVRGNVLATSEYQLEVTVNYSVVEQAGGRVLMQGQVTGRTSFFVATDLQTAEIQALPLAFSDAAVKLTSRLSEGF
jgi:outer membrane lipopolysaccharide assembly protein LptE/RlpB